MSKDTISKVGKLSNPVGQAMYAYEQATGKDVSPRVKYNGATYSTTANVGADVATTAQTFEANRQAIKENNANVADLASDQSTFDKFNSQNADLLNNPTGGAELYTPSYKKNKTLAKDQDAMVSLFNNRKQQILQRQAAPGVTQTRYA